MAPRRGRGKQSKNPPRDTQSLAKASRKRRKIIESSSSSEEATSKEVAAPLDVESGQATPNERHRIARTKGLRKDLAETARAGPSAKNIAHPDGYLSILRAVDLHVREMPLPESEYRFPLLRKFEKALDRLYENSVKALPHATHLPLAFKEFLSSSPVQGRGYSVHRLFSEHEVWRVVIKDHTSKQELRYSIPQSDFTREKAKKIGQSLCDVVARWPYGLKIGKRDAVDHRTARIQLRASIEDAFPDHQHTLNVPAAIFTNKQSKGTTRQEYITRVFFQSKEDKCEKKHTICIGPETVDMTMPIPKLPANITVGALSGGQKGPPKEIPKEERPRHDRTIELSNYLASLIQDRIFDNVAAAVVRIDELRRPFVQGRHWQGPYKGKRLLIRSAIPTRNTTYGLVGREVLRDLTEDNTGRDEKTTSHDLFKKLPDIVINSAAYARWRPVHDATLAAFQQGLGIKHFIRAGARAGDLVNEEIDNGEPAVFICSCSTFEAERTLHSCLLCGEQSLCSAQTFVETVGYRVCPRCHAKHTFKPTAFTVKRTIRRHVIRERKRFHGTYDVDKRVQDIIDKLPKGTPDLSQSPVTIADAYFNIPRKFAQTVGSKRQPFQVSVEATRPFIRLHEGELVIHGPGNISLIALWVNFAKHEQPVGIFHVLRDLIQDGLKPEMIDRLVAIADEMSRVTQKSAYVQAARLSRNISQEEFEILEKEWRSGKLAPSRKREPRKPLSIGSECNLQSEPKGWRKATINSDFLKLVDGIVAQGRKDKPHIQIARSSDGCWFPGHPSSMPEGFGWWMCFLFFGNRLWRLWLWCNGCWTTVDTIKTLYAECLYQWFRRPGFLGLPWTWWTRHGLRLAISHARHGHSMQTGFTSQDPKSMADYDEHRCNIRMQTCTENWAEAEWDDPEFKRQIHKELLDVTLSKQLYDPEIQWGDTLHDFQDTEDPVSSLQKVADIGLHGTLEGDDVELLPELNTGQQGDDKDEEDVVRENIASSPPKEESVQESTDFNAADFFSRWQALLQQAMEAHQLQPAFPISEFDLGEARKHISEFAFQSCENEDAESHEEAKAFVDALVELTNSAFEILWLYLAQSTEKQSPKIEPRDIARGYGPSFGRWREDSPPVAFVRYPSEAQVTELMVSLRSYLQASKDFEEDQELLGHISKLSTEEQEELYFELSRAFK